MLKDYEKLLQYALRIISKKRYTTEEMRKKLGQFFLKRFLEGDQDQAVEKVVARLEELKYLDDQSYCRAYVSDRINFRPKGRFLIGRELRMKGISEEMVEKAFEELEFDEVEVAMRAAEKFRRRHRDVSGSTARMKLRNKLYQYLASRGFSGDAIYKVWEGCYNRGEESES